MKLMKELALAATLVVASVPAAQAGLCDYRVSSWIGAGGATAVMGASTTIAASDIGLKAAGYYLIPHSTSGAIMIGSTATGSSAAGTVGIIGGTEALGWAAAAVTSPEVIAAAGVAALVSSGIEGGCYFADERVTDFKTVHELMKRVVENADPTEAGIIFQKGIGPWFWRRNPSGKIEAYQILNLYIVNGELMHRDQFLNSSLGLIGVKLED